MSITDPESLNEHFNDLFRQGQLEALTALYDSHAVMRLPDGSQISGHAQIAGHLAQLLTLRGKLVTTGQACSRHGDLALLTADWSFKGEDGQGLPVEFGGRSAKVVKQEPDGTWCYLIDA